MDDHHYPWREGLQALSHLPVGQNIPKNPPLVSSEPQKTRVFGQVRKHEEPKDAVIGLVGPIGP